MVILIVEVMSRINMRQSTSPPPHHHVKWIVHKKTSSLLLFLYDVSESENEDS